MINDKMGQNMKSLQLSQDRVPNVADLHILKVANEHALGLEVGIDLNYMHVKLASVLASGI